MTKSLIKNPNEFMAMYQISLRGYFETEKPDELIEAIKKVAAENDADIIGQFQSYRLAPYVDYQKADVTDPSD